MLTHIRAKNFKSWADSGEVQLAPLTGFFGTNSSGKSSLLQMLLLLKQTAERSNAEEVIFFGDERSLVNLGSFGDVIHGHQQNSWLSFAFSCKLSHLRAPYKIPADDSLRERLIDHFAFDCELRDEKGELVVEKLRYLVPPESERVALAYRKGRLLFDDLAGETSERTVNCYGAPSSMPLGYEEELRRYLSAFEALFFHVYYLAPTRVIPQRCYHWEGEQPEGIGQWGDETIDALLSARIDRLTTRGENGDVPIEERISAWLREMALAHSFSLKRAGPRSGKNYELRVQQSPASPPVSLVDMGYGLSQFLPVLVLCYYAPEGSTLILEQPGMHLHPKVQSQLADLLIEVVTERNLQVLVESHSEHLLTRLQLRIAEEKIDADKTALYFCENNDGVSEMKSLELDELGNIKNWPPDFFGTVRGDLVKMTRAQMKRQKRTEG